MGKKSKKRNTKLEEEIYNSLLEESSSKDSRNDYFFHDEANSAAARSRPHSSYRSSKKADSKVSKTVVNWKNIFENLEDREIDPRGKKSGWDVKPKTVTITEDKQQFAHPGRLERNENRRKNREEQPNFNDDVEESLAFVLSKSFPQLR